MQQINFTMEIEYEGQPIEVEVDASCYKGTTLDGCGDDPNECVIDQVTTLPEEGSLKPEEEILEKLPEATFELISARAWDTYTGMLQRAAEPEPQD